MMFNRKDVRFILVCLILFMVGGLLRIQAGWIALPRPAEASDFTATQELSEEALAKLHETVVNFYNLVDKGNYEQAYHLSFENKWSQSEEGTYTPIGLTSEDEFVELLSDEIGSNGMGLNIISIEVTGQTPLTSEQWLSTDHPELQTLNSMPDDMQVQGVYEVEINGVLLGRCSRWDWHDKVLVAQMQGDQGWRLLLPGRPKPTGPHHEEWFLDRNPLKGKTIVLAGHQT